MNEWTDKAVTWLLSIVAGLLTLVLGFGRYWVKINDKRHDSASAKIGKIEASYITRDTFIRVQDDWKDEIHQLREESNRRLDKIEGSITGVYQILLKRGGE